MTNTAGSPCRYRVREYVGRVIWSWVHQLAFRTSPRHWNRWRVFLLTCFGAHIAKGAYISPNAKVMHPWLLRLGPCSVIKDRVEIYNMAMLTLGEGTVVDEHTYLCGGTYDGVHIGATHQRLPITIGDHVRVETGCFIGPGVTIASDTVIRTKSLLTNDLPQPASSSGRSGSPAAAPGRGSAPGTEKRSSR